MASLLVASPTTVILAGIGASAVVSVTQFGNEHGVVASGFNSLMVEVVVTAQPGATVGLAEVGAVGGADTAVLSPGYNVTVTNLMYGSTEITLTGDGGQTASIIVLCYPPVPVGPFPPTIVSMAQALEAETPYVVAFVTQNPVTGSGAITAMKLYRSPTPTGPFSFADQESLSAVAVENQLFDSAPVFGLPQYYVATAIDSYGAESGYSNVFSFDAFSADVSGGQFSPGDAALGPYPWLGSDIFLNPITKEGVIGPNGDLMVVNGLYLLAQDLGIRIETEIGELALHQSFGFVKGKSIGRGQARPDIQALELRADVITCLYGDPRVNEVLDVVVTQEGQLGTGWLISYTVMAKGVNSPLSANKVVGYGL